jgi:hypothetical protein
MTFVQLRPRIRPLKRSCIYIKANARRKGTHLEGNIGRGPHSFRRLIKGTVPRDFRLGCFHVSVSPSP